VEGREKGGMGGGRGKGGEMTQTLYAHMNKRKKKRRLLLHLAHESFDQEVLTEEARSKTRAGIHKLGILLKSQQAEKSWGYN
jgi:hypothetical protein